MEVFKLIGSIFIKKDEAESNIDSVSKQAQNLASTVGNSMKNVGDKISSVGTKMLPVTVAIAGIGTVAVQSSAEMKALNSQFEQTFGELQGQATEAMGRVATESGILQTRLQGVGTSIYAFAKSSGADSAEAMSLMETALRATADASAYYDRSLEETSESLMSFLKGNFANDAQLGVSCTETTRNAKAMELFGQKYNDLSEIQKQQTLLKMVTDAQALSGAMGQASRESDGFENVMGNLKESVKLLGAEFGEVLLPTVINLIQKATAFIQNLGQMDERTKNMIVTAGLFIGAISPILIVGGKLISGIGTVITLAPKIISGIQAVGTGAKALWAILSANPIGAVITIITALVAGFIYLWNNCEEFRNFWINLWDKVKSVCSTACESVKNIISNVKSNISNTMNSIKTSISNGLNEARNTVSNVLNNIKNTFTSVWNNCKTVVSNAVSNLKSIMNFSWSLPKLKLPHVKISGSFSLNPPSVPKFSISWYKKAMNNPLMFTRPTIFDVNPITGQAKGAGEAGDEVMIGKNTMLNMIQEAVAQENALMMGSMNDVLNRIFDLLSEYVPELAHTQMVLDTGVMVGELAPAMDTALGAVYKKRKRGV